MARRIAVAVLGAAVVAGAVTLVALEGGEVAIVRTRAADGTPRETRTWVADADGAAWIEAASPERAFLRDALTRPAVELRRRGRWLSCRAEAVPNPGGHQRIRDMLGATYGWKDWWIGWFADTRRSVALRLTCEET